MRGWGAMTAAAALAAATVAAMSAGAEEASYSRAFTVVNDTGMTAVSLRIAVASTLVWGDAGEQPDASVGGWADPDAERLADGPLMPGGQLALDLGDGLGPCYYDLKVVFDDGEDLDLTDVDLCAATSLGLAPPPPPPPPPPPDPMAPPPASVGPSPKPPLDRGLPVCPGDPRCKKK